MATIHTTLPADRPGHHGEYIVGQTLSKFSEPKLELWFDVNYIPGITDIDLILFDSQIGLYVILKLDIKWNLIQIYQNLLLIMEYNFYFKRLACIGLLFVFE